jgi:hypothetical protein
MLQRRGANPRAALRRPAIFETAPKRPQCRITTGACVRGECRGNESQPAVWATPHRQSRRPEDVQPLARVPSRPAVCACSEPDCAPPMGKAGVWGATGGALGPHPLRSELRIVESAASTRKGKREWRPGRGTKASAGGVARPSSLAMRHILRSPCACGRAIGQRLRGRCGRADSGRGTSAGSV